VSRAALVHSGDIPWPPSVHEFFPPDLFGGNGPWFTKFTLLVWLAVALIIVFFLVAYRDPKMVPGKMQWIAESIYGFNRNDIARDVIGHEGIKFAPYLATLFTFIAVTNIFSIIPGIQISPNSHIAFPAMLAIITYVLYIYWGIRRHGFGKFVKQSLILPDVPWWLLPLLIVIEFAQVFVFRPITLALRLFANMFAGHIVLLVFTLGGFLIAGAGNWFIKPISVVSWALAILITFLEALICLLQAYVFVMLTSSYLQTSLAEEH
jgi:F-type H+-transporting ATPase subunit a